jgi:hypothetical protein
MLPSNLRPKWWQLYLTFPLLITLFAVDARLKISVRGHQALQLGILLLAYGLIHLWLKANAVALSAMNQRQDHGRVTVIRVPIFQLPETDREKRSILELPASEITGALSDTFKVEYIDVDVLSIDEISQELKKE